MTVDPLAASALTSDKTHLPAASLSRITGKTRERAAERKEAMPDGCLSGDTLVATPTGSRRIDELLGRQTLLTDCGWVDADVSCFGRDWLNELRFTRGNDVAVVYATDSHRWLLADGSWTTTVELAENVVNYGVNADLVNPAEAPVALAAQQTANAAGRVAVIDKQNRPFAVSVGTTPAVRRHLPAESAPSTLSFSHPLEIAGLQAVLHQQAALATSQPSRAADPRVNSRSSLFLAGFAPGYDAVPALGSVPLVPFVEIARWTRLAADSARDVADVVDRNALTVRRAATHGADHTANWKLVSVSKTDRYEDVYCAEVPDLYRFVLANGVLTGNSFPIRDGQDLKRAIKAFGRAKDKGAAKRHIIRRARALGKTDLLPDTWQALATREFGKRDVAEALTAAAAQPVVEEDPLDVLAEKADRYGVPLAKLKVVYDRGLTAAASTSRTCVSNEDLAHARVNAYLLALTEKKIGVCQDFDLLPSSHPSRVPPFKVPPIMRPSP